jgi:CRP/FNR family transcriptional regulator
VTGCHLPGELFGFSGIGEGLYSLNAKALQPTWVCEFPFDELETSCRAIPGLQSRLLHLMSERIVDYQEHFSQLKSANPVEKRLAALLLSLSSRSARHGQSPTSIRLPMSGQDTASYLGVSAETVSREFSRLARNGTIAKSNRDVTILDLPRLRRTVCDEDGSC